MMFAAPLVQSLSPTTTFLDLVQTVMPKLYGEHPQFQQIDWNKTQWFRGSVMFTPRMQGSLAEHGLSHKSVLRFRTPGLEGLRGSCG
jgi:phenol hydroxylase P4 protein